MVLFQQIGFVCNVNQKHRLNYFTIKMTIDISLTYRLRTIWYLGEASECLSYAWEIEDDSRRTKLYDCQLTDSRHCETAVIVIELRCRDHIK